MIANPEVADVFRKRAKVGALKICNIPFPVSFLVSTYLKF